MFSKGSCAYFDGLKLFKSSRCNPHLPFVCMRADVRDIVLDENKAGVAVARVMESGAPRVLPNLLLLLLLLASSSSLAALLTTASR
jgi:hypothetical protein